MNIDDNMESLKPQRLISFAEIVSLLLASIWIFIYPEDQNATTIFWIYTVDTFV